jgi:hypothetical protein
LIAPRVIEPPRDRRQRLSALEAVCASQMLALDVIFNEFAREAAKWKSLSQPSMKMALRAQSQCRATLKTLASLSGQKTAQKKSQNFDEQTIESGRNPAEPVACGAPQSC